MGEIRGKVRKISDMNELQKIREEINKSHPYYFRKNAADINLEQGSINKLTDLWNEGRLFNEERELRWTGKEYLLLEEDSEGEYEIKDNFIFLVRKNRKIHGVKYLKNGIVQFIRFKRIQP